MTAVWAERAVCMRVYEREGGRERDGMSHDESRMCRWLTATLQ